jgi:hypothetical protein
VTTLEQEKIHMARRVINRRELRKASDAAELQNAPAEQAAGEEAPAKKGRKPKGEAAPRAKKPRKKKEPPRMCARWGVFDAAMKQVAIFDYNQEAEAEQKIAELVAKKNAKYFKQIVKEPMAEPAPAEESV